MLFLLFRFEEIVVCFLFTYKEHLKKLLRIVNSLVQQFRIEHSLELWLYQYAG